MDVVKGNIDVPMRFEYVLVDPIGTFYVVIGRVYRETINMQIAALTSWSLSKDDVGVPVRLGFVPIGPIGTFCEAIGRIYGEKTNIHTPGSYRVNWE